MKNIFFLSFSLCKDLNSECKNITVYWKFILYTFCLNLKDLVTAFLIKKKSHKTLLAKRTFVSVINRPLIEVTMIIPTRIKEMC